MNEKQIDLIVQRLISRMEKANTRFLKGIGTSIKELKELTPTKAQQLVQILKYGGNYENIITELSKYTNLNVEEIENIFIEYAKTDQNFYKQFYEYKNIPFVPYEQNPILKKQTMAISNIAREQMYDFTRSKVIGYTIDGKFHDMKSTYNLLLDTALLNVGQGKETFEQAMSDIMKQIGGSGLKTLDFESGRSIRLDSAIEMHLKGRLRELHNENQKIIGEEFGADGMEITVHEFPAPDHANAQGRIFSTIKPSDNELSEFEKLQQKGKAIDYKGRKIDLHLTRKDGTEVATFRPISEMNCYHYTKSVLIGVSKPSYTDDQLQEILDRNEKGFDFEGKHYTMYEGTQLQRQIERKIREQKDIQILGKASDTEDLIIQSEKNITQLLQKYQELSNASGLPTQLERIKVEGYRRFKVSE